MVESFLDTEPVVVAAAGHEIAGTAGGWQEWAAATAVTFADAACAAGNRPVAAALERYTAQWQPAIRRLTGDVETLGGNLGTAAGVVGAADLACAQLLTGPAGAVTQHTSTLHRPVNFR